MTIRDPRYSDRISPLTADWSGNLYDFYSRVASRLTADVKTPFALDKEMYRIDDTPVHKSIRECLANTLVHADFYGRRGIRIEKHFRRITFANPGTFRVPLDIAIAGGTSDARNDVLFTLFALVEIGEKLGTGLVQLFALWEQNGWPRPEFKEQFDPERTFLTLDYNDPEDSTPQKTGSREQENCDANGKRGPENSESGNENRESGIENAQKSSEKTREIGEKKQKSGVEITGSGPENNGSGPENNGGGPENNGGGPENSEESLGNHNNISVQQEQIIACINENSVITMDEIKQATGIAIRTIKRRLSELKLSGRLRRVGPDKGGHWEVLETN